MPELVRLIRTAGARVDVGVQAARRSLFVTGGTGYLGRRLIPALLARGHRVAALARAGSEGKLPDGCEVLLGNALDASSFAARVPAADTFVHLVGTAHPAPWKARQFREVDAVSVGRRWPPPRPPARGTSSTSRRPIRRR